MHCIDHVLCMDYVPCIMCCCTCAPLLVLHLSFAVNERAPFQSVWCFFLSSLASFYRLLLLSVISCFRLPPANTHLLSFLFFLSTPCVAPTRHKHTRAHTRARTRTRTRTRTHTHTHTLSLSLSLARHLSLSHTYTFMSVCVSVSRARSRFLSCFLWLAFALALDLTHCVRCSLYCAGALSL